MGGIPARVFFCIELPESVRQLLTSLQAKIHHSGLSIKWVELQNLHVTLLFLGELDQQYLAALEATVPPRVSSIPCYSVSLDKLGCFPNPRRPKVVWAGIGEGRAETMRLHTIITEAITEAGIRVRAEGRGFVPHITLGRIRESRQRGWENDSIGLPTSTIRTGFQVEHVTLMRSDLTASGPIYTPVFQVPLLSR